jgi:hypothetical protein
MISWVNERQLGLCAAFLIPGARGSIGGSVALDPFWKLTGFRVISCLLLFGFWLLALCFGSSSLVRDQ